MRTSPILRAILLTSVGFAFVFLYAPILSSFVFSFNSDRFPTLPLGEFTFDWYRLAYSDELVRNAFGNSLIVGLTVAPVATLIGFGAAYADYRLNFLGKRFWMVFSLLPPLVPVVVVGLAMLVYFSRIGISGTLAAVIVSHIVLTAPFAMAVIRLRLAQIDDNIEYAARNLGASDWRSVGLVIWPATRGSVLAAFMMCLAVSLDEYAVAWFIGGLNETVAVRILSSLQSAVTPQINAIGSVTFITTLGLILGSLALIARSRRRDSEE